MIQSLHCILMCNKINQANVTEQIISGDSRWLYKHNQLCKHWILKLKKIFSVQESEDLNPHVVLVSVKRCWMETRHRFTASEIQRTDVVFQVAALCEHRIMPAMTRITHTRYRRPGSQHKRPPRFLFQSFLLSSASFLQLSSLSLRHVISFHPQAAGSKRAALIIYTSVWGHDQETTAG